MNKKGFKVIIVLCIILFAAPSFAMDFMLGARAGYFVWQPYFQDMEGSGVEELETGSGVLYGPAASVIFTEDISFSAVALFGKQSTYWDNDGEAKMFGSDDITSTGTFFTEIKRIDVDSALSYRIMEKVRVFAGYKYQYTETKLRGTFIRGKTTDDSVLTGDVLIEVPSHGPALGIGYSSTIGTNFFYSLNLSGLYMFSRHRFDKNQWDVYSPSGAFIPYDSGEIIEGSGIEFDTQQVGLNVEPMAGISAGNVIATLGFRFQWVRIRFVDDPVIGGIQFAPSGWMNDYLYGVFVGALYKI